MIDGHPAPELNGGKRPAALPAGQPRPWLPLLLCLASLPLPLTLTLARPAGASTPAATPPAPETVAAAAGFGQLPLYFEANQGQADPSVLFVAHGRDRGIYLTADGIWLDLAGRDDPSPQHAAPSGPARPTAGLNQDHLVRLTFLGANRSALLAGLEPCPGRVHYLMGPDRAGWHQDVPTFARVRCEQLYPGVDLVYYGNSRQLEFDFIIAPGADPSSIALRVAGADRLEIDRDGDLVLHLGGQQIRQHRPSAWQELAGVRRPVPARYVWQDRDTVGLRLGRFDRARPLTIDPVLSYSTFFGGSKTDVGWAIAVDGTGSAYIAGDTRSLFKKIPPNGYQTNYGGGTKYGGDAFVAKLDPSGSNLVFLTYLGGSDLDGAQAIAVDGAGSAYITGYTDSPDFPISGPGVFQPAIAGTNDPVFKVHPPDAFVTKLDPTGAGLLYSTYLGGEFADSGTDIAVDALGFAYVVGYTESAVLYQATNIVCANQVVGSVTNVVCFEQVVTNRFPTNVATALTAGFPITNAVQVNNRGGTDLFLAKIAPDGASLVYSTYLGGDVGDYGTGVALDALGNVAVAGWTVSTNLPVTNAIQAALGGLRDAFVAKFDATGTNLVYLTYLGGTRDDLTYDVAMDAAGNTYVAGLTASTDFLSTPGVRSHGGVFQSVDGGGSWSLMSSGLTHTIAHTLWADTTTSGLVYAGTPRGIFKTVDGGLNWASANAGLTALDVNVIVADPAAGSTLWAGTSAGLFLSEDAGLSWTNSTVNLGVPVVRALLFEPGDPATFYAGTSSGLYKSFDHGSNWFTANKGLKSKAVQALAVHPSSPSLLYAGTAGGIFASTNAGLNWNSRNVGLNTKNTRALVIDPSNPQILYAGTAKGVYKSTDAALSWTITTNGLGRPPVSALLLDPVTPTTLYAGTTNGIFKTIDAGATWVSSQTNLTSPDVTALAFDAAAFSTLYAGTRATNFAGGTNDAFLVKLVPDGRALAYAFTFGGSRNDEAWDVAVDASGQAFLTGQTASRNFPVTGASSTSQTNLNGKIDAFVAGFDATGLTNLFSIYLGGRAADFGHGIALDALGNVYVVGRTESGGFGTTNALQPKLSGDHRDAFVTKLAPGP